MTIAVNNKLLLWGLGVIQPATPDEVIAFLSTVSKGSFSLDVNHNLKDEFSSMQTEQLIALVSDKDDLFSLTERGNARLSAGLRRLRDRIRLFLLKNARKIIISSLGDRKRKMGGVSPSGSTRENTQEVARPIQPAVHSPGRLNWPHIGKQFLHSNSDRSPSKTIRNVFPTNYLKYYSIAHSSDTDPEKDCCINGIQDLSLAIGISPRLITSFMHSAKKHYRTFTITKKNGGERVLSSPKIFLKTVQYFILDYILYNLKVHPKCYSYKKGVSIQDNARIHLNRKYVANMDIQDYFGSISTDDVCKLLIDNKLSDVMSYYLSYILTYEGKLPQGAPTSPILSNSYLYNFDQDMDLYCSQLNCNYSRYSDDITISSDNLLNINLCVKKAETLLFDLKLEVNKDKFRIQSNNTRQVVTGLVVNEKIQPSRSYLRKIRAKFHNFSINKESSPCTIEELKGYYNYLNNFESIRQTTGLCKYKAIISNCEMTSAKSS